MRGITEVSHRLLYVLPQFPLEYVLWMRQLQAEVRCLRGAWGFPQDPSLLEFAPGVSDVTCFITPVPHGVDEITAHNVRLGIVR